jgi:hypothetical protein
MKIWLVLEGLGLYCCCGDLCWCCTAESVLATGGKDIGESQHLNLLI